MNKNIELTNRELNKQISTRMGEMDGPVTAAKLLKTFPWEESDAEYIRAYVKEAHTKSLPNRRQHLCTVRGYRY